VPIQELFEKETQSCHAVLNACDSPGRHGPAALRQLKREAFSDFADN
jgi:hypothetical protein